MHFYSLVFHLQYIILWVGTAHCVMKISYHLYRIWLLIIQLRLLYLKTWIQNASHHPPFKWIQIAMESIGNTLVEGPASLQTLTSHFQTYLILPTLPLMHQLSWNWPSHQCHRLRQKMWTQLLTISLIGLLHSKIPQHIVSWIGTPQHPSQNPWPN